MALQKFKKSKAKTRSRKAKYYGSLQLPNLVLCPDCGNYKEQHKVCARCGKYKGKVVINNPKFNTE